MIRYAGLREWLLTTPMGRACVVICTLTGILLGLLGWFIFAQPSPPVFYENFSGAKWIKSVPTGETGYFRKRFYVNSRVDQAWFAFAANDYYEVAINGIPITLPIGQRGITSNVTGEFLTGDQETEFDATPFILQGENCITIYVRRRVQDREPALLVKGLVHETNETQWIYSDASWKAKNVPDDTVGISTWTIPYMLDDTWPNAQVIDRSVPGNRVQPLKIPPGAFEHFIQGKWIGAPDPSEQHAYFNHDFCPSWMASDTWLEVGATGDFEVYLNGRVVTSSHLVNQAKQEPRIVTNTRGMPIVPVSFIDLAPWLTWGQNHLEIRVENALGENAALAEILSVQSDGSVKSLPTDSSWMVHGAVSPSEAPARELANCGDLPYGSAYKIEFPAPQATSEVGRETLNGSVLAIVIFVVWWLSWVIFSRRLADKRAIHYDSALILDALAQVPILVFIVLAWLLAYDVRLNPNWSFQPLFFFLVMIAGIIIRCGLWIWPEARTSRESDVNRYPATRHFVSNYGFGIALLALVIVAFVIRVSGLMTFPLDHDEVFIRNCTHGILERGFPSEEIHGLLYRMTTYEFLPWPEFVCAMLTGWQDWSLRVPSLVFATLTTGLIGLFGSHWFDRRTGLLAAALYTFIAWDVDWSRHCFHLQQTQFFALLCFYAFYRSIVNGGGVDRRYFPAACVLFCTTYLTWEGSGFILPAFVIVLIVMHPTDWIWLRQFHFWVGFIFVSCVVVIQLTDRAITLPPYLALGFGLGDITGPSPFFLDPDSDIYFYITRIFFNEAHVLPLILVLLGLVLYWNHKPTRYILVLFFSLIIFYSGFLPVYSIRYWYYYQPLLLLGGCGVVIRFYDRVASLAQQAVVSWAGLWARVSVAAVILMMFLAASEIGIKIYRLTYLVESESAEFFLFYHDGYFDYQAPSLFINDHFKPGDEVISLTPHTFMHFTGKFAYGFNPLLVKRMFYVSQLNPPGQLLRSGYADRYSGTPDLRNMLELQDVLLNHRRIWIMAAPLFALEYADPVSRSLLEGLSSPVYEDANSRVYLWDGSAGNLPLTPPSPTIIPGSFGAVLNPGFFPQGPPTLESSLDFQPPLEANTPVTLSAPSLPTTSNSIRPVMLNATNNLISSNTNQSIVTKQGGLSTTFVYSATLPVTVMPGAIPAKPSTSGAILSSTKGTILPVNSSYADTSIPVPLNTPNNSNSLSSTNSFTGQSAPLNNILPAAGFYSAGSPYNLPVGPKSLIVPQATVNPYNMGNPQ